MSGDGGAAARAASARFAAAHRDLLNDGDLQFQLNRPPPPASAPPWLHALGEWIAWALRPVMRAFAWLASWLPAWPWARILLWTVIGCAAGLVVALSIERVRHGEWRLPRWRRRRVEPTAPLDEDEPLFEAAPARALLREADALAALGHFAEAVHLLLFRSVEDLARRRPGAVRPALTSRELAAATAFPPIVRERFARIAGTVERSLFGGRQVDLADWQLARTAYAELALPGVWRR